MTITDIPKILGRTLLSAMVLTGLAAIGQPGHFGKKFIIRTNVVDGRQLGFNNLELEYVLGRKLTLGVSYNRFNFTRNENGVRSRTGSISPRGGKSSYKELSTLSDGTTSGSHFGINARIYYNRIIPAPYGWYTAFYVGIGKATYTDYKVSYEYKEKSLSFSAGDEPPLRESVTGLSGESTVYVVEVPSFGYQRIFSRLIVLDTKFGIATQYCNLPDNLVSAIENNYYVRGNAISYAYNKFNFGLFIYLKLGVLLF
jgi:hypothetical protein